METFKFITLTLLHFSSFPIALCSLQEHYIIIIYNTAMTVSALLLSFGVLLFISPIFTAGAPTPSRHPRSSSKTETCHLQILQAGTKVVEKLAENMFSYLQLQNNTLKQTPLLDGVCSFVVLYEVAKNTSVPLSQLLEQNIKDSCSFVSQNGNKICNIFCFFHNSFQH